MALFTISSICSGLTGEMFNYTIMHTVYDWYTISDIVREGQLSKMKKVIWKKVFVFFIQMQMKIINLDFVGSKSSWGKLFCQLLCQGNFWFSPNAPAFTVYHSWELQGQHLVFQCQCQGWIVAILSESLVWPSSMQDEVFTGPWQLVASLHPWTNLAAGILEGGMEVSLSNFTSWLVNSLF